MYERSSERRSSEFNLCSSCFISGGSMGCLILRFFTASTEDSSKNIMMSFSRWDSPICFTARFFAFSLTKLS